MLTIFNIFTSRHARDSAKRSKMEKRRKKPKILIQDKKQLTKNFLTAGLQLN